MITGWVMEVDGSWEPRLEFKVGSDPVSAWRHARRVAASLEQEGFTVYLMGW
jgi:hypothetical protein